MSFIQCATNRSTIDDLVELECELNHSDDFTDEEWDNYLDRLYELQEKMDRRVYTTSEQVEIAQIKGRITAKLTKKSIRQFKRELEVLPELLNGFLEGFTEEMDK